MTDHANQENSLTGGVKRIRQTVGQLVRFTAGAVLTCAAGCAAIALVVPFVKIMSIQAVVNRADDLVPNQPAEALALLNKFSAWAIDYPSAQESLSRGTVLCHMRLGNLDAAKEQANWVYARSVAPPALPRAGLVRMLIEHWPNQLANALSEQAAKGDPLAGYDVVLDELHRNGNLRDLEEFAGDVLKRQLPASDAKRFQGFLDYAREMRRRQSLPSAGEQPATRPVLSIDTTPAPAVTPLQPVLPATGTEPVVETPPVPVTPKQKTLSPAQRDAQNRYDKARDSYEESATEARKLETEFGKASGARRSALLDKLRLLKGDVSTRKMEMEDARQALNAEGGTD